MADTTGYLVQVTRIMCVCVCGGGGSGSVVLVLVLVCGGCYTCMIIASHMSYTRMREYMFADEHTKRTFTSSYSRNINHNPTRMGEYSSCFSQMKRMNSFQ